MSARAQTENFPVASLLFPPEHPPHLRAICGFARLVDILGDEWDGDRLARWTMEAEPTGASATASRRPVIRRGRRSRPAAPAQPFRRLIEANRMDAALAQLRDLGRPARLLLALRPIRSAGSSWA
jgi:phytoene/squalene synthetase